MAEMSCIKLVQNSQELVSSLRPYNTLKYKFTSRHCILLILLLGVHC